MDDLISRQVAIDAMRQYARYDDFDVSVVDEDVAVIALKDLPSTDAVEVVRCKDCKYYYYADNRIPSERGWVCANDGCYASQNDYCSWGERNDV